MDVRGMKITHTKPCSLPLQNFKRSKGTANEGTEEVNFVSVGKWGGAINMFQDFEKISGGNI